MTGDRGVESRVSAERCRAATEAALEMFRQNWTALHVDDGARLESMIHCALVAAGVADLESALRAMIAAFRIERDAVGNDHLVISQSQDEQFDAIRRARVVLGDNEGDTNGETSGH